MNVPTGNDIVRVEPDFSLYISVPLPPATTILSAEKASALAYTSLIVSTLLLSAMRPFVQVKVPLTVTLSNIEMFFDSAVLRVNAG